VGHARVCVTNCTGQKPTPSFPNPWHPECSGVVGAGMESVGALPVVPNNTANM
jgi:hypothetical protein